MSRQSLGLSPQLQDYLLSVSLREDGHLKALREVTATLPDSRMQIAAEQGQFMGFLVKLLSVERVLEIGTYTGYSALAMALAMPAGGRIATLDIDPVNTKIAQEHWEKAGVGDKIELHLGPARQTLQKLQGPFDLAFIDADKGNYEFYYEHTLKLVKTGGLILLDNVLWSGQVADEAVTDSDTAALRAINKKIHSDERVDISMLPLADGVTLVRKR